MSYINQQVMFSSISNLQAAVESLSQKYNQLVQQVSALQQAQSGTSSARSLSEEGGQPVAAFSMHGRSAAEEEPVPVVEDEGKTVNLGEQPLDP